MMIGMYGYILADTAAAIPISYAHACILATLYLMLLSIPTIHAIPIGNTILPKGGSSLFNLQREWVS